MFSFKPQKMQTQTDLKSKQQSYKKQSVKKDRNNIIQSQRYLMNATIIDWHVNITTFKTNVSSTFNYFSLIKTLFTISQELNWRNYIPHMQILISTFHNMMCQKKGANIKDISKIQQFQTKFGNLLLKREISLHKHLTLLLKMLLVFNGKYQFINQRNFSQILVDSINYNNIDIIKQTLWLLAQMRVSSLTLSKLCKYEHLSVALEKDSSCLLAFLTILANFLSDKEQNQSIILQLVDSDMFKKAFNLGIFSSKPQFINQTILIFNNAICFSQNLRNKFLSHTHILQRILSINCKQSQKCRQILKLLEINLTTLRNNININLSIIQQLKLHQNPATTFNSSSQTAME